MSRLLDLQMQLRRAVLGGDSADVVAAIHGDGLDPAARVGIYRNHALTTLGAALRRAFPVVCRLVDERFFAYAAHEYLREYPPNTRCLAEYGADFADFLAEFGPCKSLPYLPDVARFEWALNAAATMQEATPLSPQALGAIPANEAAYLMLRLQPSLRYVTSPWPIDAIWQANQETEVSEVDLACGGARLEIRRVGDAAAWRQLDSATSAFRTALADGRALGAAVAAAILQDPAFDPAAALQDIFAEGLAVAFGSCAP